MIQQKPPSGTDILGRALNRRLDGEFDRMTSIMLDLLVVPETREIGRGMIQAVFSKNRRENCEDRTEVPYPWATLALIAEANFPVQECEILWEAIPISKRLDFISQMLGFSMMNNSQQWVGKCMEKIDELAEKEPWQFSKRSISRACLGIISELYAFYGKDARSIKELTCDWTPGLTWIMGRILTSSSDEIYQDLNMEKLEWIGEIIPHCQANIHPRAYSKILAADNGHYPNLMRIVTRSRREGLMRVVSKDHDPNTTTPQM